MGRYALSRKYSEWKKGQRIQFKERTGTLLTDAEYKSSTREGWFQADVKWDDGEVTKQMKINLKHLMAIENDCAICDKCDKPAVINYQLLWVSCDYDAVSEEYQEMQILTDADTVKSEFRCEEHKAGWWDGD